MKPRSSRQAFIIALCAFVLIATQALGGNVAYYCLCSGKIVPAEMSHCHGPHGENCHEEGTSADCTSEQSDGDRKEHVPVAQDRQLRPADTVQQVVVPQAPAEMPPLAEIIFSIEESMGSPTHGVERTEEGPPLGVAVARTIVLLI